MSFKNFFLFGVGLFLMVGSVVFYFRAQNAKVLVSKDDKGYVSLKNKEGKLIRDVDIIQGLGFNHKVVLIKDTCNGQESNLKCVEMSCTNVSFNKVKGVKYDSLTRVKGVKFLYDYNKCKIFSVVSESKDDKTGNMYSLVSDKDGKLFIYKKDKLVSDLSKFVVESTPGKSLTKDNVVWNLQDGVIYISHIKANQKPPKAYITKLSIKNGSKLAEVELEEAFYGVSVDRAFPLVANKDKSLIAIQTHLIHDISIFNRDLGLIGEFPTVWSKVELFSKEMYEIENFDMFLKYSWKNDHVIEYGFPTGDEMYQIDTIE